MYSPFAFGDPEAGPPGLPPPLADPGAGPPGLPLPPSSTLDALRQQYGSGNGDDPGHHPRSPTTEGAPTPYASNFPPPPPAPAKHDEIMTAMFEHM